MSDAPWLDLALREMGTAEVPGLRDNPAVMAYFADCGHPEVLHDETAWCAAALGSWLKRSGYPLPPRSTNLMARAYLNYGAKLDAPRVGCIAVFPRGLPPQGHVGIVEEVRADGMIMVIAGNVGNRVASEPRPAAKALGFRWPVKAEAKALKSAGAPELAVTDRLKKGTVIATGATGAIAAAGAAVAPAPAPPPDVLRQAAEQAGFAKTIMEGMKDVGNLIVANPWVVGLAILCAVVGWAVWRIERHSVERAELGHGPVADA
jgi:uncharacterized protein (TIGR02594 family)